MPARTRFLAETRQRVLEALALGASRRTAARASGIGEATLRRWLERGRKASEGTSYREFFLAVHQAEATPRVRALGIIYRELPARPDIAFKLLERLEPGFGLPLPEPPAMPTLLQLQFSDARWPLPVEGVTAPPHTDDGQTTDDPPLRVEGDDHGGDEAADGLRGDAPDSAESHHYGSGDHGPHHEGEVK
jgi:hypothetical protein